MEYSKEQSIIESMLFAAGREVKIKEITNVLELGAEDIDKIIQNIKSEYERRNSGIEIIKVEDGYQMCTKKEYYEYIYPLFDNRVKPNISAAALETLSIIAYNPKITRAEIESIRGVSSDGTIYKLLEFDLIEEAGKLDAPGRPTVFRVTNKFMKMFGISSLDELPELPKYKLDENEQIVIDEVMEAPMPEREDETDKNESTIEENKNDIVDSNNVEETNSVLENDNEKVNNEENDDNKNN